MSDRLFAVFWLGVCTLIFVQMWNLTVPFAYEPVGPRAFPMLMSILMALGCGYLIIKPDYDAQWPQGSLLLRGLVLIAALLGYASVFVTLGFPLATGLMVLIVARLFGGSWLASGIAALGIGGLGFIVFDRLLEVTLPIGRLWGGG